MKTEKNHNDESGNSPPVVGSTPVDTVASQGADLWSAFRARTEVDCEVLPVNLWADDSQKEWLVDGLMPLQGIVELYGETGSRKSFVALELACRVSLGQPFAGIPTTRQAVLYVAAERPDQFDVRYAAWAHDHGVSLETDSAVYMMRGQVDLMTDEGLSKVLAHVGVLREAARSVGHYGDGIVVVLDPLADCFLGIEENSSGDMGLVRKRLNAIQRASDGVVVVVHHTGKNGGDDRGHSSLAASVDTKIKCCAGKDGLTVTLVVEKLRNDDPARIGEIKFRVKEVELPRGQHSCVLVPAGTAGHSLRIEAKHQVPSHDEQALSALEEFGVAGAKGGEWQEASGLKGGTWSRTLQALKKTGRVVEVEGRYRIVRH